MTPRPYVLSADVHVLMERWAQGSGFCLPEQEFFQEILDELRGTLAEIFPRVDVLQAYHLRDGTLELLSRADAPVVSLDRALVLPGDPGVVGFVDPTRTYDPRTDREGLGSRTGEPLEKQVRRLAAALPGRTVTLADDSVFSGGTLLAIAALFTGEGVAVTRALCGAATADGTRHLAAQGIEVESVVELGDVLDNVSQRDFVAGVPMSGRTVPAAKRHRGAPYMLPFGKPVAWASIPPAHQLAFSIACLRQSIRLWEAVEAASGREAPSRALDKPCVGLADDISIATGLGRVLREMEGAAGDA